MVEKLGQTEAETDQRDWASIREVYESGRSTITIICERFQVTKGALEHRSRIDRWIPRQAREANERSTILARMFKVLDRQVHYLENTDMTKGVEKEALLLGTMTKTLEKLIELDKADRGNQPTQKRDMQELRNKLAKRIDELIQR